MTRYRLPRPLQTAAALALAALVAPAPAPAQDVGLPLGTQAPAAMVEDLDGNPVQLLDLVEGRPALVEFWAVWCEQCEALQPQLDRIQAELGDRLAVVAVGVAVNQNPRRIRRHLESHDPGYPFVYDGAGEAVRAYRAPTTSVIVVLDADGLVAYTGVGADQDLMAAVRGVLEEGSGGRGPSRR